MGPSQFHKSPVVLFSPFLNRNNCFSLCFSSNQVIVGFCILNSNEGLFAQIWGATVSFAPDRLVLFSSDSLIVVSYLNSLLPSIYNFDHSIQHVLDLNLEGKQRILKQMFLSPCSRVCLAVRFLRYELEREWSKLRLEWKSKFQKV